MSEQAGAVECCVRMSAPLSVGSARFSRHVAARQISINGECGEPSGLDLQKILAGKISFSIHGFSADRTASPASSKWSR